MKRLSFLLLLVCTLAQAQHKPPGFIQRIPEPVKAISLFSASIILDGIGDGLCDSGDKSLGHALQAASTGLLVLSPLFLDMDKDNWWWYAMSYVSLRIGLFDYSYNITRDLPLGYIGSTSTWDKAMQQVAPPGNQLFVRGIFLTIGIVIPLNEL